MSSTQRAFVPAECSTYKCIFCNLFVRLFSVPAEIASLWLLNYMGRSSMASWQLQVLTASQVKTRSISQRKKPDCMFIPCDIFAEAFIIFRHVQNKTPKSLGSNDRSHGMQASELLVDTWDGWFNLSIQMKTVQPNAGRAILGISQEPSLLDVM